MFQCILLLYNYYILFATYVGTLSVGLYNILHVACYSMFIASYLTFCVRCYYAAALIELSMMYFRVFSSGYPVYVVRG